MTIVGWRTPVPGCSVTGGDGATDCSYAGARVSVAAPDMAVGVSTEARGLGGRTRLVGLAVVGRGGNTTGAARDNEPD